jgi:calcineurin-like phosphoesterase family protein
MNTYFWADMHFNHENIIGFCNRPYRNAGEMNRILKYKWNMIVTNESDHIWVLGDFMFKMRGQVKEDMHTLFHQLRGIKHLIIGNHDVKNPEVLRLPWESQDLLLNLKLNGHRFVLCHYPLESWSGSNHGSVMLHGHCHGNMEHILPRRFDVGVDVRPWPVLLEDIISEALKANEVVL